MNEHPGTEDTGVAVPHLIRVLLLLTSTTPPKGQCPERVDRFFAGTVVRGRWFVCQVVSLGCRLHVLHHARHINSSGGCMGVSSQFLDLAHVLVGLPGNAFILTATATSQGSFVTAEPSFLQALGLVTHVSI